MSLDFQIHLNYFESQYLQNKLNMSQEDIMQDIYYSAINMISDSVKLMNKKHKRFHSLNRVTYLSNNEVSIKLKMTSYINSYSNNNVVLIKIAKKQKDRKLVFQSYEIEERSISNNLLGE